MAERHGCQPVDADVDLRSRLLAARKVEVAPARCAAAHENGVVTLPHQLGHRLDALLRNKVHAHVQDVSGLLVDHGFGQPEARDLRPHEAASLRLAVEDGQLVPQRREIARHGERRRPCAHARDALAVARGDRGHAGTNVLGGFPEAPRPRQRLFKRCLHAVDEGGACVLYGSERAFRIMINRA